MRSNKKIKLRRIENGEASLVSDVVASEEALAIYVNGRELVTLLYTPPMALELALGYMLSEDLISKKEDVAALSLKKDGILVTLAGGLPIPDAPAARVLTSGCGGGITFTYPQGVSNIKRLSTGFNVPYQDIVELAGRFRKESRLFEETGGVHSAALSDGIGFLAFAEDIGRHNAVDKVFGKCLMAGIDTRDRILLTTGRISSEILLKAAKRKVPVVVSRGAPTALAVELAEKFGITLVGFARGRRMNVYTHQDRISL